ncbi:hypothetical protein GmRootV59_50090 [Variovorax sp. V59]|uniref:pilus assembly protein n=1 Tax=unclassified Variovorax TaxID=663243 RepID=UPI0034E95ED0
MKNRFTLAIGLKPQRQAICCAVMICALLLGSFAPIVDAASTDLSNQPLATLPAVQAKPNLLFVLDDSGSMDNDYMPDQMSSGKYGYRSAQCNGVGYDPTMTYSPPLNADGTSYPNAIFTAARSDGYDASSSTVNLNNRFYYTYSGTQPKMGWAYTSSGAIRNTFYNECMTSTNSWTNLFQQVTVTSTSAEAQNYANWYSYYRKRYLLMRTAMGRAISALDSSYRVGFSTISDGTAVDGNNYFRDVKDFDLAQKTNFYSSLYSASPTGWTPLRSALSKAGRYFANKAPDQSYDPVQYSCQRNYALLSTDGYWNMSKGLKLDGTTEIGQQDGTEARPMRDDSQVIITTVTPYTVALTRNALSTQTQTRTWTRTSTTVSSTPVASGQNKGKYAVTKVTNQRYTETQSRTYTTPQSATRSYSETVVTTDGVETSRSTSTSTTSAWVNTGTPTESFTGNGPPTDSSSFTSGNTNTTYQAAKGDGVTVNSDSAGSWSSWSTATTSNTTPVAQTPVAGTPTQTPSTSGGTGNTLADVAQYYFATDLRTSALGNCTSSSSGSSQDVCSNIVRPVGSDKAAWQHMNSFTIGLGVSGTLPYDKNYLTQTAGSYVDLTSGALDWPVPEGADLDDGQGGNATNVDDLWHAAINGRGQYYSALNASALSEAINGVVTSVQQVSGSGATASTSSLQLVAGDNNLVFRASYTTQLWTGDLQAFAINGSTGVIANTATWSAQAKLDATAASDRRIYFSNGSALQSFEYNNLSSAQKGYFDNLCGKTLIAAQCSQLSDSNKALANNGTNLVNYLRGVRTYETASVDASNNSIAALYRKREHVLGDIINGAPVYVGKPPFRYADAGYADFVTAKSTRTPVVYVGSNDGMLHAFSAATGSTGGNELWAYVPGTVMPNLYKMADTSYGSRHQYSVDGAPVMGDIKVGTTWKTIVVGGLNSGGRGYYALDITDPNDPKALWEFTDANLGFSFGNPVIAKRGDGTWIVAFASGYNNTSGDGKGHLYVLNANTGALLLDIATSDGSSDDPSGLAKINAWIESSSDNTAKRFYGGDQQGNLWRFDIDGLLLPNRAAMRLAKFQVNDTTPQPITTKPETVEISGKPVVVVATGRYLGASDIADSTQQSIYAVKDTLTATGWSDVRADTTNFVRQTFTLNGPVATATAASVSNTSVDWATKGGWWIDLPHSRERVNTNLGLQFSTLSVATAIPNGDACASGGTAWRYYLNVANGGVVTTNPAGGLFSTDGLIMGMTWVQDSNGNARIIYQKSNGDNVIETPPVATSSGSGSVHRTSWRELVD